MAYYIHKGCADNLNYNSWRYVVSGEALDYRARGSGDREGTFAGFERLDLRQMFEIADLAPTWDCLDPDFYDEMADEIAISSEDEARDSCAGIVCAVEDYLEKR